MGDEPSGPGPRASISADEIRRAPRPLIGVLGQEPHHQSDDTGVHGLGQRRRIERHLPGEHHHQVIVLEGRRAAQHLVQDDSERRRDRQRCVHRRSRRPAPATCTPACRMTLPSLRELRLRRSPRSLDLRDAEVQHLHELVAVLACGRASRCRASDRGARCPPRGRPRGASAICRVMRRARSVASGASANHQLAQALPLDVLEHEVERAVLQLAEVRRRPPRWGARCAQPPRPRARSARRPRGRYGHLAVQAP